MRICQIADMDVVTNGRSIRCRIVSAEYLEYTKTKGRANGQGNCVGLGIMTLTKFAIGVGASGVEIELARFV
jgi:hypothetical protein